MLSPSLITLGGPIIWILLIAAALALATFIERFLHYHRAQINSTEFTEGIRNVLRQSNTLEAISICDATPGPIPRLIKAAILRKNAGHDAIRQTLQETGQTEIPRLEEKLNLLATIAQIAPLIGLFGTTLGLMQTFAAVADNGLYTQTDQLAQGIWQALIATAAGLALAIPTYAAYNYLISRVHSITIDMQKTATEILNILTQPDNPPKPNK